ncbi:metallophosphoesterase family protein [Konateibacter massiliensis]|uniref:metallophosphoesterase family protein n=1 Tax=Konateibacter massiliensis TaxID=2002841 RepID=UPI000C15DD8C|nr:metallophosphoesterase family protein [Konateibacter massiliensis]
MVIAVLSDIHGNYIALEKCIGYALERGADTFLFLGDYVGELAYPQRTMEMIYSLNSQYACYFVKGNKEDYWLDYIAGGKKGWKEKDSTTGALLYTYNNLTERDISFFGRLSHKQEIQIESMPLMTICHGSPNQVNEKLLPDDEKTFEVMKKEKASLILCGHTHIQTKIEQEGKVVLNPGAAGVPLYSEGKAQFLLLHAENGEWKEEFVSLPYDVAKVISDLHESGLCESAPYWCKVSENLLQNGDIPHSNVLAKAMARCAQENGSCNWPNIPEKYWAQAVKEMIK